MKNLLALGVALLGFAAHADQPLSILNSTSGNYVNFTFAGSTSTIAGAPASTTIGHCVQFTSTTGALADAGFACGSGSGTVTSVALSAPSIFTVSGSPVTGSGTLTLSYSGTALPIANGGTGQTSQTAAFNALAPTPTRAGDLTYWNGSNYVNLAGNNSGTQVLQETSSGVPSWVTGAVGTVTSVSQTVPSGFSVTGSPVTGSGTLAITYATGQTANQFLATPNGSTGALGLRSIVAADVPTLNQSTTGSAGSLSPGNTINGVSFTGASPITVAAAAGTLTGSTLASGVTASSLTSVGTLSGLTVTAPIAGSVTGSAASLSATLGCGQFPALTGAITTTAGGCPTAFGTDSTAYSFLGNFTGAGAIPTYTTFASTLGNALRLDTAENKIDFGLINGSTVGTPLTGASHAFTCADSGKYFYRSNSGSAMTDTFPTCQAGFNINIRDNDASATDTITSTGNTFGAGSASSYTINYGRRTWFSYDGTSNFGNVANDSNLYEPSGTNTATHIAVFGTRPSIDLSDSTYSFPLVNGALANSATTVNGQTCTLGSSCTVTAAPSGTAGGDLSGSYPNPTVANVNGVAYPASPSTNTIPYVTGTNTVAYEPTTGTLGNVVLSAGTPTFTGSPSLNTASAASVLFTGSSAPTNGIYAPTTTSLGFATNSSTPWTMDSSGRFLSGTFASQGFGGVAGPKIQLLGTSMPTGSEILGVFNVTQTTPELNFLSSTGATVGSHGTVAAGGLAQMTAVGDDGTNYTNSSRIIFQAAGTISTGIVPGQITFQTANASGALTNALTLTAGQAVLIPNGTITINGLTGYVQCNGASACTAATTIPVASVTGAVSSVTGTAPIVSSGGTTPAISITAASATAAGSQSAAQFTKTTNTSIDVVADEGAYGDAVADFTCSWTTSSTTITCTDNPFTSTAVDGGKVAVLTSTVVGTAALRTTIATVTDSNHAVVAATPTTSSSGVTGFQFFHDDTTAINNAIALQQSTYPGRCVYLPQGVTGRYAISSSLTTVVKHFCMYGIGAPTISDAGDYTKAGGSGIVWAGSTQVNVLSLIPTTGASNAAIVGSELHDFYIDCRNGDQNECLSALTLNSVHGWNFYNIAILDPLLGIDNYVVSTLGETTDNTRGTFSNIKIRVLDSPKLGTAEGTTTGTGTFATTSFSLAVSSTTSAYITPGYFWVMSNLGYYQLTNCTGGGNTTSATTLTGCTVAQINNAPTWVASANVLQATPTTGTGYRGDGSTTGNNCCLTWLGGVIQHNTVLNAANLGPPAMFLLDTDSAEVYNLLINGGDAALATTPLVNRVQKPGVGCYGGNTSIQLECRNNHFTGGSPGVGGFFVAGLTNTGAAVVSFPPAANYWDMQQQGNAEPAPVREALTVTTLQAPIGPFLDWTSNGAFRPGPVSTACPANISYTAGAAGYSCGSTVPVPPQGLNNLGAQLEFHTLQSKTAAGTAARVYAIRLGSTGTTTDTTIETVSVTPSSTATADTGESVIRCTVNAVGASGSMACYFSMTHTAIPSATTGGLINTGNGNALMTPTTYNSTLPASGPEYLTLWITPGASEVFSTLIGSIVLCTSSGAP